MNRNLDGFIRSLTQKAAAKLNSDLEDLIIQTFGSREAFMLVKDDYVLEVHDSFPDISNLEENAVTLRIESTYRIRRKTPEEKTLEKQQDLLKGEQE